MHKLSRFSTLALISCFSTATLAANPGFYLGGNISYNSIDKGGLIVPYDNLGGGLSLGYNFQINQRFLLGTELASNYMGSFDGTDEGITGVSLLATATVHLNNRVDLFMKGGVVREVVDDSVNYARSDTGGTVGIGLAYSLNDHWDTTLQFNHIFGNSILTAVADRSNKPLAFNNVLFGFTYNFGPKVQTTQSGAQKVASTK